MAGSMRRMRVEVLDRIVAPVTVRALEELDETEKETDALDCRVREPEPGENDSREERAEDLERHQPCSRKRRRHLRRLGCR